jgi:hypothetical protein
MMEFNDYCSGTSAITQGDMSSMPERPTQWGLQAAQQAALSRLNKDCQTITEQSYYDMVRQLCHNNVQFMENEFVVKTIGSRYEEQLRDEYGIGPEVTVAPWDLDMGSFEIQPLDRMQKEADLSGMQHMMDRMLSDQNIALEAFGGVDVRRMLLQYVRKLGFKNVHEFKKAGGQLPPLQGKTMPDEEVLNQAQAGNLVPVGAMS